MCTVLLIMLLNSVLSPIKCFMIVDVETRSHLTANYHVLTCTIIDYQELSFTWNMFKIFHVTAVGDDSFSR